MTTRRDTRVLIIGSGPAGYTAAVYASRAMLNPILVQGLEPGGQLTTTTEVENWPGDATVQGPDLMVRMEGHAREMGAEIITDIITDLDLSKRPFVAKGDSGTEYVAEAVILATGARAKWLGLPSEKAYKGFGVSACATCDGFFFRGKEVVIIGGGDTAMEEANFLTRFATKVTVIHRRDSLRASKIMQDRALNNPKIEFLWNNEVTDIIGTKENGVTAVKLKNTQNGEETEFATQGVFVAIGHKPNTDIFKGKLDMDETGYLKVTPGTVNTSIEGVYACGDVQDKKYRQAITAAGTGCMAAMDAEKFIEAHESSLATT